MKTSICVVLCAVIGALLFAGTAPAAFIAYEPFAYSGTLPLSLLGQTNTSNGFNWLRAGTSADPTAIKEDVGTPPLPALTNGMPAQVGNALTIKGIGDGSGAAERLNLGALITSGTVYYSLTLRIDSLSGSNTGTGGFFIGFNNTGNSSQTGNPTVAPARIQARIDPSDGTKYDLGIFNGGAVATPGSWTSGLAVGVTHFIVAGYTFNPAANDDVGSLWIDPDPSTFIPNSPPSPIVTNTGSDVASPGIQSLLLRQSPGPFLTLDEIRVGTDWTSVTVPEPATCVLLLLSSVFGAFVVRRRSA